MSTLEATISMLESMPTQDQLKVYEFTKKLLSSPFTPVTKNNVLNDLANSESEFENGQGVDAIDAIFKMRQEHDFI